MKTRSSGQDERNKRGIAIDNNTHKYVRIPFPIGKEGNYRRKHRISRAKKRRTEERT
jgi:hypothetical protein